MTSKLDFLTEKLKYLFISQESRKMAVEFNNPGKRLLPPPAR